MAEYALTSRRCTVRTLPAHANNDTFIPATFPPMPEAPIVEKGLPNLVTEDSAEVRFGYGRVLYTDSPNRFIRGLCKSSQEFQ